MNVTCRRYKLLQDFETVSEFLRNNYNAAELHEGQMQSFWEYAHTHPHFDHKLTHRFGLWEVEGSLVGIAFYQMTLGEAYFSTMKGYEHLKPEMLKWAERELSLVQDGKHRLSIWVTDAQTDDREFLIYNGYETVRRRPVNVFPYKKNSQIQSYPKASRSFRSTMKMILKKSMRAYGRALITGRSQTTTLTAEY